MLTYKQAYDKIIQAYFKDEIRPWDASFCFCGNICDNTDEWYNPLSTTRTPHFATNGYSGLELHKMERALLDTLYRYRIHGNVSEIGFEDALFSGMCAALEVLKQIHKDRGENVDEEIYFTKRQLNKTTC